MRTVAVGDDRIGRSRWAMTGSDGRVGLIGRIGRVASG